MKLDTPTLLELVRAATFLDCPLLSTPLSHGFARVARSLNPDQMRHDQICPLFEVEPHVLSTALGDPMLDQMLLKFSLPELRMLRDCSGEWHERVRRALTGPTTTTIITRTHSTTSV